MTGSTGPGYLSTTIWYIVWSNFQIFLDVETIFNLFGFQVFLFCIFLNLPCYYWLYLSNQHLGEKITLELYPSGKFLLVYINKYHIRVESTNILILDFNVVLPIYNLHTFLGAYSV